MTVIARFAPSPTGRLHIGNVRTALINWLFVRKHAGRFVLRLDDTDRERSTEAFAAAIREDLAWLGLDWDDTFRQSDRTDRYDSAAAHLKAAGRLYPCFETEDELDRKRKRQAARGLPPLYDRAALRLSAEERDKLEASGLKPHWRFRLANTDATGSVTPTAVTWNDLVRGPQSVDVGSLSDPVLIRGDGTYLYTFTSVVDDVDSRITHVVRGEDHVTNTGVQAQIFDALEAERPTFAHFSLLVDKDGSALSKRLGSLSVESLRAAGLEAMAVNCHAALIGSSDAIAPYTRLEDLVALFDFAKLSRTPSRFDLAELEMLNAKLLHTLPYGAISDRLTRRGITAGEPFWRAVAGNLARFDEVDQWKRVIEGPIEPRLENTQLLAAATAHLPPAPWNDTTWSVWTTAVRAATGEKGRALFHPLRLAITGQETGPDMKALLPLMDRERVLARLAGRTA
jgi:glutamyl-tRNA synthetase